MFNPYVILGLVGVWLATGVGGYLKGNADCSARYEYSALRAERDALREAIQHEQHAREQDAAQFEANETELRKLKEEADAEARRLSQGDRICFDPADADSLRRGWRTTR